MRWFSAGGDDYARYRPTYPAALVDALASAAPDTRRAVDVGCGTGQLTALLAERFTGVVGLDPAGEQIAHAVTAGNIDYRVCAAEHLAVEDHTADLVTAAQAAHWFDLSAFYGEVRRIAVDDAVLALITYGVLVLDDDLADRFGTFYREEIGPYWPPERRHVDNGYAELEFPFERLDTPAFTIERSWTLEEFVGYLGTWSAVRRAGEADAGGLVDALAADLAPRWGDDRRVVRWPVTVIAGRVR